MNEAIKTLNRFTRDTFGLGGIFHGAGEVGGEEWSFGCVLPVPGAACVTLRALAARVPRNRAAPVCSRACAPDTASRCEPRRQNSYCPYGTGVRAHPALAACACAPDSCVCSASDTVVHCRNPQVYSCTPKGNPNYTFRESIPLGVTSISTPQARCLRHAQRAASRRPSCGLYPKCERHTDALVRLPVSALHRGPARRVAGLDVRPAEPQLQPLLRSAGQDLGRGAAAGCARRLSRRRITPLARRLPC